MVSRKPRERVCAVCGAARPHRGGGAASGATRERARKMTEMNDKRLADLVRFYSIITTLESKIGGAKRLSDCSGRASWPQRGVYFFHEPGENRTDTGEGPRIVRVGTHALKLGSGTKLWTRLSQHKGPTASGGGNHRGSIFRLIVTNAHRR
jgi:hypothetical protein